ncbi:MDR family MFS transporter [Gorillibacterium sp. sgz5001074]|uniref:MDR family MFS transporter n=1 Tax=Gorillibacterium sp. sgz5001074 TaxID=3446695 RepID=UPI003F6679B6
MQSNNKLPEVRFWPIMVALFFGSFVSMLATSTINIALPVLTKDFNTTLSTIQWTLTGFMLAMGTFAPVTGYFGERFSYKRVYLVALAGFTLVSVFCALSNDVTWLIAFRTLQGVFGGVIVPSAMAVIYQVIPREKQPVAIGIWAASAMLAPALGPTFAGWLLEHVSWHWLFWINVPFGLIAILMVQLFMPYYRMSIPKSFDLVGFVTVIVASSSLLVGLSQGHSWGWSSVKTVTLFVVGAVFLALFIWRELTTETPLLNLRVLKNNRYTLTLIISIILTISLYSGMLLTPVFLQNVQGVTPLDTGLILLPSSLVMAFAMPIVGKLYTKLGARPLITTGILLVAAGTLPLSWLSVHASHSFMLWCMVVRNLGISLTMMPVSNAGMEEIPPHMSGHASSLNNWIRNVFGSFAIAVFTTMMATRSTTHAKELMTSGVKDKLQLQLSAMTMGIDDVFYAATLIILVALPIILFIRKKPKKSGSEPDAAVLTPQEA